MGGGMAIVLACDLRFDCAVDYRFHAEVELG
jgi:enoyl-CoA hydratase/carnithine racemase